MSIIAIVGSGMMGSALAFPLDTNGHTVRLIGTPLDRHIIDELKDSGHHLTLKRQLPERTVFYQIEDVAAALSGADLLVNGVSSFGVDWFMSEIIPLIPESLPVLSVTKGMVNRSDGQLVSFPEVFEAATDRKIAFNAIGGPCIAAELADHDHTEVAFCGRDPGQLRWLKSLFATDYYHISLSTDVRGVECAVALKNAFAMAVSLAIGLSYKREGREFEHLNSQAALFSQSLREMAGVLRLCGGDAANLASGIGDLYVTVFGGRSRKLGTLLGKGMPFDQAMASLAGITLESVAIATRTAAAIRALIAQGQTTAAEFPLLLHIDEIINQGKTVAIPWAAFESEFFKPA